MAFFKFYNIMGYLRFSWNEPLNIEKMCGDTIITDH